MAKIGKNNNNIARKYNEKNVKRIEIKKRLVGRLMDNGTQLTVVHKKLWDRLIDSTDYSTLHNLVSTINIPLSSKKLLG